MSEPLLFPTRQDFRAWLMERHASPDGVWLLFGKPGGPATLKASEALEEALCFGWIDGQILSLDALSYQKYFSPRRPGGRWSEKNRALALRLQSQGLMAAPGLAAIEAAKSSGQWSAPKPPSVTPEQVAQLLDLLAPYGPARTNFIAMPPSVKKTYARAYFSARTDSGRQKRLAWMVDRLRRNLKPM